MADRHEPATDRDPQGPDAEHHPSPMRRRTVLTAAVAGTTAIVARTIRSGRRGRREPGDPRRRQLRRQPDHRAQHRPVPCLRQPRDVRHLHRDAGRSWDRGDRLARRRVGHRQERPEPVPERDRGRARGDDARRRRLRRVHRCGQRTGATASRPVDIDGPPTTGSHDLGEILFDRNGRLFACSASGFPGHGSSSGSWRPPRRSRR